MLLYWCCPLISRRRATPTSRDDEMCDGAGSISWDSEIWKIFLQTFVSLIGTDD